ncbi:hypothetical protein B0H11DRAFT_2208125 [Mycena galericulata]|nr:hypothetical protein B0H11DRAFT_2208125 [Mycena galericulata]
MEVSGANGTQYSTSKSHHESPINDDLPLVFTQIGTSPHVRRVKPILYHTFVVIWPSKAEKNILDDWRCSGNATVEILGASMLREGRMESFKSELHGLPPGGDIEDLWPQFARGELVRPSLGPTVDRPERALSNGAGLERFGGGVVEIWAADVRASKMRKKSQKVTRANFSENGNNAWTRNFDGLEMTKHRKKSPNRIHSAMREHRKKSSKNLVFSLSDTISKEAVHTLRDPESQTMSKHTKNRLESLHHNITCLRHPDQIGTFCKSMMRAKSVREKSVRTRLGLRVAFVSKINTACAGPHDPHGPVVLDIVQHFGQRWNEIKKCNEIIWLALPHNISASPNEAVVRHPYCEHWHAIRHCYKQRWLRLPEDNEDPVAQLAYAHPGCTCRPHHAQLNKIQLFRAKIDKPCPLSGACVVKSRQNFDYLSGPPLSEKWLFEGEFVDFFGQPFGACHTARWDDEAVDSWISKKSGRIAGKDIA